MNFFGLLLKNAKQPGDLTYGRWKASSAVYTRRPDDKIKGIKDIDGTKMKDRWQGK